MAERGIALIQEYNGLLLDSSNSNHSSSRPVHVCIVGHSYVGHLQELMCRYHPEQYDNLGFDRNRVVVHCLGVGGATVLPGDKCILHQLSDIIHIQPDIVYVHIGENDLCSLHGSNVFTYHVSSLSYH